jgi:hypothetical protein
MRERLRRLPSALLIVLVGLVVLGGAGMGRYALRGESDAAKNERTLKRLVPPAGARVVSKRSAPTYESTSDISSRKTGYATDLEYKVSDDVSSPRAVAEHYARQLRGWKRHEEVIPCEDTFVGEAPNPCRDLVIDEFTKGDAKVALNIDGFVGPRPWGYELTISQREESG